MNDRYDSVPQLFVLPTESPLDHVSGGSSVGFFLVMIHLGFGFQLLYFP